jgi:hypothetical protein
LLISWPGRIPPNTVVEEMASHLDIFATILDYAGGSQYDNSDGVSLRRFIEGSEINAQYEEDVVFAEWDYRKPTNTSVENGMEFSMDRPIDDRPSFLVRHRQYKLMMQKVANTNRMDMMFDIAKDPFEIDNLLSPDVAMVQRDFYIAKAEHMRCLLLEWMERMDKGAHYFSDPVANHGDSAGDIPEIRNRQRWKQLGFWVSDDSIEFGRLSWNGNAFVRHEHLYMGTRMEETVQVTNIVVEGRDAQYFHVDQTKLTLKYQDCAHVRVSFTAPDVVWKATSLDATLVLTVDLGASTTERRLALTVPQSHAVPNQDGTAATSRDAVNAGSQEEIVVAKEQKEVISGTAPSNGGSGVPSAEEIPEIPVNFGKDERDDVLMLDGALGCSSNEDCTSKVCASVSMDLRDIKSCCVEGLQFHYPPDDMMVCGHQLEGSTCFTSSMCQSQNCVARTCQPPQTT